MNVTIYPGRPSGVNFEAASVVKNIAGATVQYCDTEDPFISEGSIAVGASQTLTGTYFFVTPATALLSYTDLGPTTDAAIATLGTRIGDEEAARAAADTALSGLLTAEATARAAGDAASRKFFPVPTGADDAAELLSRLGAGEKDIALRRDTYNWNQVLGTIPAGTHLSGEGRATIVNKNVNGTLATLADSVILERMKIIGNGASRTGQAFVLPGTDGHQTMRDMSVTDFDGFILDFAVDAGSLSFFENCEFWQTNGSSGGAPTDAHYAVRISATTQAAAVPRKFVGCESGGYQFIDFGGGGGTTLMGGGYLGEVKFRPNTTAVKILGVRLGGATASLAIDGGQNVIQGCDIYPALTIAASAQGNVIGPNTMNTPPYVTDNSGNNTNLVTLWGQSYTPTWTASGTAPVLGNGTLVGYWSRSGNLVNFAIRLIAGSTTTFGTGTWRFALPMAPTIGIPQIVPAVLYDGSANDYANIHGHILGGGVAYLTFPYPALGSVGPTVPWTWATTDIVHVSGSYMA